MLKEVLDYVSPRYVYKYQMQLLLSISSNVLSCSVPGAVLAEYRELFESWILLMEGLRVKLTFSQHGCHLRLPEHLCLLHDSRRYIS